MKRFHLLLLTSLLNLAGHPYEPPIRVDIYNLRGPVKSIAKKVRHGLSEVLVVEQFDRNGNISKMEMYHPPNSYDSAFATLMIPEEFQENSVDTSLYQFGSSATFKYGRNGKLLEKVKADSENTIFSKSIYRYDDFDSLIAEVDFYPFDSLGQPTDSFKITYSYHPMRHGYLKKKHIDSRILETYYIKNWDSIESAKKEVKKPKARLILKKSDKHNRLLQRAELRFYSESSTYRKETELRYSYDLWGNIRKIEHQRFYDKGLSGFSSLRKYRIGGFLYKSKEISESHQNGEITRDLVKRITYDWHGNVGSTKETRFEEGNKKTYERDFRYDYDHHNNWIAKYYKDEAKEWKILETRKINYY